MSGIASILSIASQSMWASQTGIEVASNNISNMNTPGYVKQGLQLNSRSPVMSNGLIMGRGVEVSSISMVQDRFLDFQMYNSKMDLGYAKSRAYGMSNLEEIFNESDSDGLSKTMADFFSSIQDLSSAPEGQSPRVSLVGQANILTNQFHTMYNRIDQVRDSQNSNVRGDVDSINILAKQINEINKKIPGMEDSSNIAADLRSTRNNLMDELAELIDYTYFEDQNGMVNIMVGGSRPLVEGGEISQLVTVGNADGYWDVFYEDGNGRRTDITSSIDGGSLGGALQIRDVEATRLMDDINEIAFQMSTAFNNVHRGGVGLNGNTGLDFFVQLADATDAAKLITLNPIIENDVGNIAASLGGEPGDNANALNLANVESTLLFNGGAPILRVIMAASLHGSALRLKTSRWNLTLRRR